MTRAESFPLYIDSTVVDVAFMEDVDPKHDGFPAQPKQLLILGAMIRAIATLANYGQEPRSDGKDTGISDCELRNAFNAIVLLSTLSDAIASRILGLDGSGREINRGAA